MSEADLAERRKILDALKVHPRDEAVNAAALARANRVFEGHLGDTRHFVGDLIGSFMAVLERQNPREIDAARTEMEAALDRIDGESFL